jgi:hypothetical protein
MRASPRALAGGGCHLLDGAIVEKNRHLLAGLSVGNGCIRFKDIKKVPEPAIRAMVREVALSNEAHPNDHCSYIQAKVSLSTPIVVRNIPLILSAM